MEPLDYFFVLLLVLGGVALTWDLSRRRTRAEARRRELEPYARLGEGIEGVTHDAAHLLVAARLTLERLESLLGDHEQAAQLGQLAIEQVRQAESFMKVLGTRPDEEQDIDVVASARMIAALFPQRRHVDAAELQGSIIIHGRPRQLSRLLANLVANAFQHAGRVTLSRQGRTLFVANPLPAGREAPGPEIYQRGVSGRRTSKGLGLFWSQRMAEELDASLDHEVIDVQGERWVRFRLTFARSPFEEA